jgi:hypothetical protein
LTTSPLPYFTEKPPKPKLQRERDTVERDLNFDDLQQDYEVLMHLTNLKRKLELIAEKNTDPAVALLLDEALAEILPRLAELEKQDEDRHKERSAITDFKRRERTWRPGPHGA